jgi:hypothetical protein
MKLNQAFNQEYKKKTKELEQTTPVARASIPNAGRFEKLFKDIQGYMERLEVKERDLSIILRSNGNVVCMINPHDRTNQLVADGKETIDDRIQHALQNELTKLINQWEVRKKALIKKG